MVSMFYEAVRKNPSGTAVGSLSFTIINVTFFLNASSNVIQKYQRETFRVILDQSQHGYDIKVLILYGDKDVRPF
jgi:hypothetical protein